MWERENEVSEPGSANRGVDRITFMTAVGVIVFVCIPLIIWPDKAGGYVTTVYNWTAFHLGLLYQWAVIGAVLFLGWLAFGPFGHRKLGDAHDTPEFSTFSWVAMLFCAGVGAGLLYWAGIEWAFYLDAPPYGAEPRSAEAISWSASYGLFHWGIAAWAIYALPTVAIAYPYYVKKVPFLRLSTSCHALLGKHAETGWAGRLMDAVFMVALLAGAGTSLGLAVPMISACLADIFGLERSFALDLGVIAVCVLIFASSVWLGLEKGIRRLSDINIWLALLFLLFIVIAGPTLFILRMGTDSIGFMFSNFIRMLTWTDPVDRTGFVEDWTIFYWAWWIAFGPFFGVFVTRISRGRTLRQLIVSMGLYGSLGAWAFYIVLGNFALFQELNGLVPVTQIMNDVDAAAAIAAVVGSLPLGQLALMLFAAVSIIFVATTYDSASYSLASAATKELKPGENPARWHRLFWAFMLGVLPISLMAVEGGIKVILSVVLVASLPLLVIGVLMCVSLVKSLKETDP